MDALSLTIKSLQYFILLSDSNKDHNLQNEFSTVFRKSLIYQVMGAHATLP